MLYVDSCIAWLCFRRRLALALLWLSSHRTCIAEPGRERFQTPFVFSSQLNNFEWHNRSLLRIVSVRYSFVLAAATCCLSHQTTTKSSATAVVKSRTRVVCPARFRFHTYLSSLILIFCLLPRQVSENQVITTRSNPAAFPSSLRQKKTSLVQQRDVEKKKVYVSLFLLISSTRL